MSETQTAIKKWCPGDWCRGPQPVDTFIRGVCRICWMTRACKDPKCERKGRILNPGQFREGRAICLKCEVRRQHERYVQRKTDPAWVGRRRRQRRELHRHKMATDPEYVKRHRAEALAHHRRHARDMAFRHARSLRKRRWYYADEARRQRLLADARRYKAEHPRPVAPPCSGRTREGAPCKFTTHDPSRLCRYHRRKAEQAA